MKMVLLATLFTIVGGTAVNAQQPETGRMRIVLSGGLRSPSGWVDGIERGMIAGNLDGDVCGDQGEIQCTAARRPFSDQDHVTYSVEVAFRARQRAEVAFSLGFGNAGNVSGYFDGGTTGTAGSDAELALEMRATTLAASLRYIALGGIRVGGGPALHVLRTTAGTVRGETSETTLRPGLVVDAGVSLPVRSTVFLDLGIRYRWMTKGTFGPYDALNEVNEVRAVFPATSAAFSPLLAELGLGIRLW